MNILSMLSHILIIVLGIEIGDYVPVLLTELGGSSFSFGEKIISIEISTAALWLIWNGYSIVLSRLTDTDWRRIRTIDALTWLPLSPLVLYARNHMINEQFVGDHYGIAFPCMFLFLVSVLKAAHIASLLGNKNIYAICMIISLPAALAASSLRSALSWNLYEWLELDVLISIQLSMASIFSIFIFASGIFKRKFGRAAKGFSAAVIFSLLWWAMTASPKPDELPPASSTEKMRKALPMRLFAQGGGAARVRAMVGDELRDALLFPVPGKVSDTFEAANGATLSFGVGVAAFKKDSGNSIVKFSLDADIDGKATNIWKCELNPSQIPADLGWRDFTIDLTPVSGPNRTFTFKVEGAPYGAISAPILKVPATKPNNSPNIVMILIDTLRADHVGVYGYNRNVTPFIDELAKSGVYFRNVVSTAPWTEPATFTALSGMLPGQIDAGLWYPVIISDDAELISEKLRENGYRTGAVSGNYLITHAANFDQGFETFDENCHQWFNWKSAECMTNRGLAWVNRNLGEPFFLYMHYVDPHSTYNAPPPYREMFSSGYAGNDPRIARGETIEFEIFSGRVGKPLSMPETDRRYIEERYDGEIAYCDAQIGRFIEGLKQKGLLENTIVIITSDHGEEFMEHGIVGHILNLHGTLLNVPLILWGEKYFPAGIGVDETISLTDITPTILDVLGFKQPERVWGRSVAPLWKGESLPPRLCFSHRRQLFLDEWSATNGKNKLILGKNKQQGIHNLRWFDLLSDPLEFSDISSNSAEERKMKQEILDTIEWIKSNKFALPGFVPSVDPDELRKRMKAIGYIAN